MTLKEKLMEDLKQAMRQRDELRVSVIRLTRSSIKNAEIARGRELDDDGVLAVIAREVKQRRDSIFEFSKGSRQDLVDKEQAELQILLGYLPQQITREEIAAAAKGVIQEIGATGRSDLGKVMSVLAPRLKGKAEGRLISQVVQELLA
ncbi:MAG: GatB/YqeY domain-containing protein [Chloroflexota bacterium]